MTSPPGEGAAEGTAAGRTAEMRNQLSGPVSGIQGWRDLTEIREHYLHRQLAPAGMALAQCSTGGIGQNEKRRAIPHIAAENRENVFMVQTRKFANLHEEAFHLLIAWTSPKDLQRDPRLKVAMLGEIDISETAATNDVKQTIVADLLLLRLLHLLLFYFAVHIYTIPSALPETI